jgi:hypothetical protein
MHKFYFNDCLPVCSNQHDFIEHLSNTLTEFSKLSSEDLRIEKAVITDNLPSTMYYGNTFSLAESIEGIKDGVLKRLAYTYFNKYPVQDYFGTNEDVDTELLTHDYKIEVNNESYSATNLAVVKHNNGFAFTVPLHEDLKVNLLRLKAQSDEGSNLEVHSLYGATENIDAIRVEIIRLNSQSFSNIEKLKLTLGNCELSSGFEKAFSRIGNLAQQSIIEDFEKAKKRESTTPFFPDTRIIKDVSPSQAKCKVLELRVNSPFALRVYFNEGQNTVFVSSIGYKSDNHQNKDIKKAHNDLYKMILTTN